MEFLECTELARKHNAALRRKAKIAAWADKLITLAFAIAGAAIMYGMMWLGAFLDYCAGV